jgi:hypothetical protein
MKLVLLRMNDVLEDDSNERRGEERMKLVIQTQLTTKKREQEQRSTREGNE